MFRRDGTRREQQRRSLLLGLYGRECAPLWRSARVFVNKLLFLFHICRFGFFVVFLFFSPLRFIVDTRVCFFYEVVAQLILNSKERYHHEHSSCAIILILLVFHELYEMLLNKHTSSCVAAIPHHYYVFYCLTF